MPLIHLTTRDGHELSFDCAPEQNLIDAAAAANIILPSQCRQGSCGACHAAVTSGDFALAELGGQALPADSANGVLMCCTMPRSDLRVALPYDYARILFHAPKRRSAEIVALDRVARDMVRLELRLEPDDDGNAAAEFEPGQFMELEFPGSDERRAYSLANTSNWDGLLEFFIRLREGGRFSAFLRDTAAPGMKLAVLGPLGAFGIAADSLRPRWFVAGGSGLAPMLSMLRRMGELQETHEARLFFGVNREDELFAGEELWRIGGELAQFHVSLCVYHPVAEWHGFIGTAADALAQALTSATAQPDIYVCGPPALIDATVKIATAAGLPPEHIFSERFLAR